MKNFTFMDELEKRLADLEKEIDLIEIKKNNQTMEHMLHDYDAAMDRTIDFKPLSFKNIRHTDY